MAKDYAKSSKQSWLRSQPKSWFFSHRVEVYLILAGILFITVIIWGIIKLKQIHYQHHLKWKAAHALHHRSSLTKIKPELLKSPQFDFYTILPKETVWIPAAALKPTQAPLPPQAPQGYLVQVAAFKQATTAQQLQNRLAKQGYSSHIRLDANKVWHKVYLGPYPSLSAAQSVQVKIFQIQHLKSLIIRITE